MPNNGNIWNERLVLHQKPAWHRIGEVFEDAQMDALTAFGRARALTVDVKKLPLYVQMPGQGMVEVKSKMALIRDRSGDQAAVYLTEVSRDWPVMQNSAVADLLQPLSRTWPVESVGLLNKGEAVFVVLRAGTTGIDGDEVKDYFVFYDYRVPGKSAGFMYTPVRTVCENTLVAGIGAATMHFTVPHVGGRFETDAAFYAQLMAQLRLGKQKVDDIFRRFAEVTLTDDQVATVLERVYPTPVMPKRALQLAGMATVAVGMADQIGTRTREAEAALDLEVARVDRYREDVVDLLLGDFTSPTGWALYNSVVRYADHRRGNTGEHKGAGESSLFGPRAQEKTVAFRAIGDLVGVN